MSNISLSVAERNVGFFTKGFALWIPRWDAEIGFFTKVFALWIPRWDSEIGFFRKGFFGGPGGASPQPQRLSRQSRERLRELKGLCPFDPPASTIGRPPKGFALWIRFLTTAYA